MEGKEDQEDGMRMRTREGNHLATRATVDAIGGPLFRAKHFKIIRPVFLRHPHELSSASMNLWLETDRPHSVHPPYISSDTLVEVRG